MKQAYSALIKRADSLLEFTPNPIKGILKVSSSGKNLKGHLAIQKRRLMRDFQAAHHLSVAYALTGNAGYAQKTVDIINAWTKNTIKPAAMYNLKEAKLPWESTSLAIWITFPNLVFAFDNVRSYQGFKKQDQDFFISWIKKFTRFRYDPHPKLDNKENCHILLIASVAHVIKDMKMLEDAAARYTNALKEQIGDNGEMTKETLRGRKGTTYTLMALEPLLQTLVILKNHGISNLHEKTLKKAVDFTASFLKDRDRWSFYKEKDLRFPENPADWGHMFEIPYFLWKNPSYTPLLTKRPYQDPHVKKGYTMGPVTLLFGVPVK